MSEDKKIIKKLLAGGFIGATLGQIMSKNRSNGITLGALAGAALVATFTAYEKAKKSNLAMIYEEDNVLYQEINGEKIKIKDLEKSTFPLKNKYILK